MTVRQRIWREVIWFFGAMLASLVLSFLYFGLLRLTGTAEAGPRPFSFRVYLAGCAATFCCLYAGRVMVRFVKHMTL